VKRGGRLWANLATLANGLVGVGAILYTLAGNPLWAMLLIAAGVAFDGMDGLLARRSGVPPSAFGRAADSVADAVTFGLAPATLLLVHTAHASTWAPWRALALGVGVEVAALALARLVYFTLRGYQHKDFVGIPTPQNALAVVVLLMFLDVPGFLGVLPLAALVLAGALAVLMVLPIPFPKIRRGHPLRLVMTGTAVALVAAILPLQFRPTPGSALFDVAAVAAGIAAVGVASYYVLGPFTVPRPVPS
jgi:CDP-diacylglycerol--serine O-phosphatidyltransferase